MAVSAFLRNVLSPIEFLKTKIPDYSDSPSQQFLIAKASISNFVSCRKVALCQSGRMAHLIARFGTIFGRFFLRKSNFLFENCPSKNHFSQYVVECNLDDIVFQKSNC